MTQKRDQSPASRLASLYLSCTTIGTTILSTNYSHNQAKQHIIPRWKVISDEITMVHRSFSNPLLRFTKDRRKKEENPNNEDANDHALVKNRRASQDKTVCTSDDSEHHHVSLQNDSFDYDYEVVNQQQQPQPVELRVLNRSSCTCIDCRAHLQHRCLMRLRQPPFHGHGESRGYVSIPSTSSSPPTRPPILAPAYANTPTTLWNAPDVDAPALQARIEAIKIQEQSLGISHPDVLFALSGIAKLYDKRGDHAQAAKIRKEKQLRSIMAQVKSTSGLHHEDQDHFPFEISFPRSR
jgi:hypothetical protein